MAGYTLPSLHARGVLWLTSLAIACFAPATQSSASELRSRLFTTLPAEPQTQEAPAPSPRAQDASAKTPVTKTTLHNRLFNQSTSSDPSVRATSQSEQTAVFVSDSGDATSSAADVETNDTPSSSQQDSSNQAAAAELIDEPSVTTTELAAPGPLCLQDLLREVSRIHPTAQTARKTDAEMAWRASTRSCDEVASAPPLDVADLYDEQAAATTVEPTQQVSPALAEAVEEEVAQTLAIEEPNDLPAPAADPILAKLAEESTDEPTTKLEQSPGRVDLAPLYGEPVVIRPPEKPSLNFTTPVLPRYVGANEFRHLIVETAPPVETRVAQAIRPPASDPIVATPLPAAPTPEIVAAPPAEEAVGATKPSGPTSRLSRPLSEVGIGIAPGAELLAQMKKTADDLQIKNFAETEFGDWDAPNVSLTEKGTRFPIGTAFSWAAPAVYHRPLYFEQPNLERYGHHVKIVPHSRGMLQSAISAAHFFGTIPALPYLVGAEGACFERQYTLGAYRPGSCNLHHWTVPPLSLRGAVMEGAAFTGLAFFVP